MPRTRPTEPDRAREGPAGLARRADGVSHGPGSPARIVAGRRAEAPAVGCGKVAMQPAEPLTLGVEEEFLLVDRAGHLGGRGPEVSRAARPASGEAEYELKRCQVESATAVCTRADQILGALHDLRGELAAEAARRGLRLLPSGTAIVGEAPAPALTPRERYERMAEEFGAVVDEALTCACHVHVGIPDRAAGLVISNALRPWLPVLLALVANSPFHAGVDTRHASWRRMLWSRWPSAGPPPYFASVDAYDSLVDALSRSGAILDRAMIYWDVRLSEHVPTLEIRIADVAPTAEEAALLAVLVRGLAAGALAGEAPAPPLSGEDLRARLWRATRDGLSGRCPRPADGELVPTWRVVDELLERTGEHLRAAGDADFVADTLGRLRETGCGADRQRAAFARRGRAVDVVDALVVPAPVR